MGEKNFTYENTTSEGKLSPALRDMVTIEYEKFERGKRSRVVEEVEKLEIREIEF